MNLRLPAFAVVAAVCVAIAFVALDKSFGCPPPVVCSFSPSTAGTDGCAGSLGGTAQFPSLLTTYASHRSPWNVAGVDYAVGVPSGALLDPSTAALPSGCSFSGSTVSCSGSNITVSGYDFSLHNGIVLSVTGGSSGLSVIKNKFGIAPNCSDPVLNVSITGNTTIKYNTFDGGGGTCGTLSFGTMINTNQTITGAVLTIEYNYFLNTPQDAVDMRGPGSGTSQVITKYNLYYLEGWQGHPDGFQTCGGNFDSTQISYNTYYNTTAPGQQGTQPFHVEAQCTSAITNSTVSFNTIATPGTCNGGANYPTGCAVNFDIACKQDAGGNTNSGFASFGNYIDWTGAIAAETNAYACTSTTWGSPSSNIDMSTGAALTTSP